MKNMKILLLLSCLLLVLGTVFIAGCVDPDTDDPADNNTTVPPVEDAARYRGTVSEVTDDNGQLTVILEKAEGTNLPTSKAFLITNSTNIKFNKSEIKEGAFLEVYHGNASDDGVSTAIAINLLPAADQCIYNGVLEKILETDKSGTGVLTLKLNDDDETVMEFAYSTSTQFYLNFSELKEGDMLNIFAPGPIKETSPPQTDAAEVSPYRE
jgi:hypothetical protein